MMGLLFMAAAAGTLYYIIMFESREAWWLLIAEGIWFLFAALQLVWYRRCVSASLDTAVRLVDKGDNILPEIKLRNKGAIPIPFVRLVVKAEFNGETVLRRTVRTPVGARAGRRLRLKIPAKHAGKYRISVSRVVIYDMFHLFRTAIRSNERNEVTVLPRQYPVSMEISSAFRLIGDESGLYEERAGSDPSEVLEVREYRPGDRVQKIHWKLTQRTGDLWVREFGEPARIAVIFLLNTKSFFEEYLETVLSISMEMCRQRCPHYLCWKTEKGVLTRRAVVNEEQIYLFVGQAIDHQVSSRVTEEEYRDWFGRDGYQISLNLTAEFGELKLYRNQEEIGCIDRDNLEESLGGLVLEL